MKLANLGRSGLKVSPLALGTAAFGDPARTGWSVGADEVWPIVRAAVDHGISLFDTGSTYGNGLAEERLGAALERIGDRYAHVICTKLFFPTGPGANDRGLSRKHLFAALDRSLKRLRTDHVDLLMIHRWDGSTPIEETLAALDQIVRSGRALYLGASSMSAWRLMKALGLQRAGALAPFVAMQGHYNLLYREEEREMIPLCREEGLGYMAWSPLARGLLAGVEADPVRLAEDTLLRRYDNRGEAILATLARHAEALGRSPASVALAWLSARGALPVFGPQHPGQVASAVAAVARPLDDATIAALEQPYEPQPVLGFDPADESGLVR